MSRSMKSTGRRLGVVVALALGLAAAGPLASVAGAAPAAAKPKAVAVLKIQNLSVSVQKKGAGDFKPAKDGQKLHEGDTVQTDAAGLAEVDYSDDSYTRLDVSTTLKIVKLSDDQGNRQVETSVDAGRTWNRTAALTESQSFEQSGAGATAAVVGTAFAVQCDAPVAPATTSAHCTTIAIEHVTKWTGADGVPINLNPLDSCDATNGVLCQDITHLTPDQLGDWIQSNLYLDLVLRGLGPGPISGTVVIQNGQATFTPTTPPAAGGTTPSGPTTPPVQPPVIDAKPVCVDGAGHAVSPSGGTCANGAQPSFVPSSGITTDDDTAVGFTLNGTDPSAAAFWFMFDILPTSLGSITGPGNVPVNTTDKYVPQTTFTFTPSDVAPDVGTTGFDYHAVNDQNQQTTPPTHVDVTVTPDCIDESCP